LKLITRYTLREILAPFLLALLAFTSLLIVDRVFDLTKHFVEKGINPWYMVEMLFYFSPAVFVLTIPMAVLVGIVTAFGRLAADNEITAMKTSGVGMHRLIAPVVIITFALSIFMVFFMDLTLPRGNDAYSSLNMELKRKHPALVLEPETIMEELSREDKKWSFDSVDSETGRLKSIRIWERVSGVPKLITAEEGELRFFEEWTSLKLYNGDIYQADNKKPLKSYVMGSFDEDEIFLEVSGSLGEEKREYDVPRNMSMREIRTALKGFRKQLEAPGTSEATRTHIRKYKINNHLVELHKKMSIPFACLVFGLIGVPLGLMVRRGGRMIGLGVGLGVITLYYVMLTAGEKIAKVGAYPPVLGAWTPNIVTFVIGIVLIIRTVRETSVRSSRVIDKLFPSQTSYGTDTEVKR